ncbi:MAG: methyltransferase domain-containing protein [Bacteroidetes bacterium]|nr:methyltransferase domain-containing protein [Bacteroidota bacterium]
MSWYKHWFADELYLELYAHRDSREAHHAVDLFESVTHGNLRRYPLLDLACGSGRHAFELARRGYHVTAADLSPTLLHAAARKTQRHNARVHLVRTDMRALPFRNHSFGAVLQLFTAFGYFRSDEANEAVLHEVRSVLRPGAWYMLDFFNSTQLRDTLIPVSEQCVGDTRIVQERRIEHHRVEKTIRVFRNGDVREYRESVRLFTLEDFQRMFQRCRLRLEAVYGDYTGGDFTPSSPRCLMFTRANA